jgi:hypothetical protein
MSSSIWILEALVADVENPGKLVATGTIGRLPMRCCFH